jgi:hypothetical protein
MKESQAIVQRAELIAGDYKRLELAIPEALQGMKSGQCLLVRPKSLRLEKVWHPYLRQVWYPVLASNSTITVEIETRDHYQTGDVIDVIGPVGKNYQFRRSLRNVLLLAYNTPPFPLLMSIPVLLGNSISVTMVLLGKAAAYPTHHLPPEVEVIRGDNPEDPFAWADQVTTIGWADQVFAVVPAGDEVNNFAHLHDLFSQRRAEVGKNYLFGVFQSVLPCGVGACDACLIRTGEVLKRVCVDGPAFDLSRVKLS